MDGIAGDPARIFGREKGNDATDIVRLCEALERLQPSAKSRPPSVLVKFDISVSTTPGATALTRIPRAPSRKAKCFTSVSIAPLVAA